MQRLKHFEIPMHRRVAEDSNKGCCKKRQRVVPEADIKWEVHFQETMTCLAQKLSGVKSTTKLRKLHNRDSVKNLHSVMSISMKSTLSSTMRSPLSAAMGESKKNTWQKKVRKIKARNVRRNVRRNTSGDLHVLTALREVRLKHKKENRQYFVAEWFAAHMLQAWWRQRG